MDGVTLDDPYNPLPITSTLSYSAASVGDTSLFVWFALDRDGLDILGGRIGAMGALMDPIPLSVSGAPGAQTFPAIGASANGFLVAWQDQRAGDDIYATLVTPTGQVGSEFAVAATSEVENGPRVVWNGESYLVLWTEGTTSGRVRGTRVDATGGSGTSDMRASGGQGGCACDMHARDVSKQGTGYALAGLMAVLAARMRRKRPAIVGRMGTRGGSDNVQPALSMSMPVANSRRARSDVMFSRRRRAHRAK